MRQLRASASALAAATLVLLGCFRAPAPLSPAEAALVADATVERILLRDAHTPFAVTLPTPRAAAVAQQGVEVVRVWYPTHPLMNRLAQPAVTGAFTREHPHIQLEAQPIGDWLYAVQKLAVHLAGGGLPEIAVVRRDLLAQLAGSGRLMALDGLLSPDLLDDFLPPTLDAFRVEGRLVALPADGFHTVLFAEPGWDPQTLWHQAPDSLANQPPRIGHLPFVETLWAHGAAVVDHGQSALATPAAVEAFEHYHGLVMHAHPENPVRAAQDAAYGVSLFLAGGVPATVASSREYPAIAAQRPEVKIHPIPGTNRPVSRGGNYAIVVFAEASGNEDAVAAVLDFLTGPVIQGAEALSLGAPPVRAGIAEGVDPGHPLVRSLAFLRAPPLIAGWGEIEDALARTIQRIFLFHSESP